MASKNIKGITIEIDGNAQPLQKALQGVNKTISSTSAALKDINKLLKLDPTNVDLLKQKQQDLRDVIAATSEKLKTEKEALAQLKKQPQTDEVINQQERLEREIIETEQKLNSLTAEFKEFGSVTKQQVQAAADAIGEVGSKLSDAGQKISSVGDKLTTRVTLPIVAAGTAAAKSFADVDKTMQLVNKTMNNTTDEAEMLNKAMQEAAANSTFGMGDAAEATLNFARAGLTAAEAAAALAPAMNLAAGEGGDLATVSAGLTATINAFGDSFDNTTKYADIFAAACNNSALDVNSLSSAMSVAAPIFSAAGYTIEDAALYMGVMANAGIDANVAATSLKTGLAKLAKPTKDAAKALKQYNIEVFNADGTMKDSVKVQKELHDAFATMTNQEQLAAAAAIFGKNQMSSWLALINTAPDEVDALSASLKNAAGTTEEMSEAMMSGFGGSVEKLKSSIDVLMTSMGSLIAEAIMPLLEKVQAAVDHFNELDKESQQQIIRIAAMVAAIGPLLSVGGRLLTGIGNLLQMVPKITQAVMGMNPVIAATVAVIGLLTAAYIKMATYEVQAIDHTKLLTAEQKELAKSGQAVADSTKTSADQRKEENANLKSQRDLVSKLVGELKGYVDVNGNVLESQDRVKAIVAELNTIMPNLNLAYDEQTQAISMNTDELERNIDAMLRKAEMAAYEEQLTQIMKDRITVEQEMLKMEDEVAAARDRQTEAQLRYHEALDQLNQIEDTTSIAYRDQIAIVRELNEARKEEAERCSAIVGPYNELESQMQRLGGEEDFITDKIGGTNAAMSSQEGAVSALADEVSEATEEMTSAWDGLADAVARSVNSQVDLFGELKKQEDVSKDTLLKNMDDQVAALEDWSKNLQELSKKGISEGLLAELTKMGPEGAAKVAAFNEMSATELAKASQLFNEATKIPTETVAMVESNYAEVAEKGWQAYGKAARVEALNAATEAETDAKTVGENVDKGIIAGIESKEAEVMKTGKDLGKETTDAVAEGAGTHSPSKITRETGQDIDEGLRLGMEDKLQILRETAAAVARAITQQLDEGLDTSLFDEMGRSIGQALANGLLAMLPAVEAAAAQLIAAASRAGQAVAGASSGTGAAAGGETTSAIVASDNMARVMGTSSAVRQSVSNNQTNYSYGSITIPVYAAPGQDVDAIAEAVEQIFVNQINRQEGAFA